MTAGSTTDETRKLFQWLGAEMAKGNFQVFIETMSDDVQYNVIGTTEFSGKFSGKQAFIDKCVVPSLADKVLPFTMVLDDMIVDGDKAAMQMRGHVKTNKGRTYANTYCMVCKVANARIVSVTEYCDTDLIVRVHSP